jgi:hypothetical protein
LGWRPSTWQHFKSATSVLLEGTRGGGEARGKVTADRKPIQGSNTGTDRGMGIEEGRGRGVRVDESDWGRRWDGEEVLEGGKVKEKGEEEGEWTGMKSSRMKRAGGGNERRGRDGLGEGLHRRTKIKQTG